MFRVHSSLAQLPLAPRLFAQRRTFSRLTFRRSLGFLWFCCCAFACEF
nr:MAG TPA: hypothetical protein [Caudoviricetes sp.]